jgi:tRNA nucleotidyltransferase (CCA-adding enzyme)
MPKGLPLEAKLMLEKSEQLNIQLNAPKPILMGRHLLELGFESGKEMGMLLKRAFEAQLDGEFNNTEDGIKWIKQQIN